MREFFLGPTRPGGEVRVDTRQIRNRGSGIRWPSSQQKSAASLADGSQLLPPEIQFFLPYWSRSSQMTPECRRLRTQQRLFAQRAMCSTSTIAVPTMKAAPSYCISLMAGDFDALRELAAGDAARSPSHVRMLAASKPLLQPWPWQIFFFTT